MERLIIPILALVLLCGCETVKPIDTSKTDIAATEIQETQTQVATETHDLAGTIDTLKNTTDAIKDGQATKEQTETIVKYVNIGSEQGEALKKTVDKQTKQIASFNISRIKDNVSYDNAIASLEARVEKLKPWCGRFFILLTAFSLIVAGYVILRIKNVLK